MAIQSSIQELGLFDLFQLLHMNGKTGRLIITDTGGNREAQVLFQSGSVCMASVHDRSPKTVDMLLEEWGVVDQTSMQVVARTIGNHKSLLDCLVAAGISSKTHLESFFAARIRECVYGVFKWESGDCRFLEEELDTRREVLALLNTENLIMEGARRIDEWSNIMNKVPSRHSVFQICLGNEQDQQLNLKPKEWEILSLIDDNRSVHEINNVVGEDLFTTSKLIYGLVVMGVIELAVDETNAEITANNEERIDELVRKGTPQDLVSVQAEMEARDRADSTRADSPLACDETYQIVDTSDLGPEEVAEQLRGWIVARQAVDLQRPGV